MAQSRIMRRFGFGRCETLWLLVLLFIDSSLAFLKPRFRIACLRSVTTSSITSPRLAFQCNGALAPSLAVAPGTHRRSEWHGCRSSRFALLGESLNLVPPRPSPFRSRNPAITKYAELIVQKRFLWNRQYAWPSMKEQGRATIAVSVWYPIRQLLSSRLLGFSSLVARRRLEPSPMLRARGSTKNKRAVAFRGARMKLMAQSSAIQRRQARGGLGKVG